MFGPGFDALDEVVDGLNTPRWSRRLVGSENQPSRFSQLELVVVEQAMTAAGGGADLAAAAGRLGMLDAADTLARFMTDDVPNRRHSTPWSAVSSDKRLLEAR